MLFFEAHNPGGVSSGKFLRRSHPYHLVDPSPYPILAGLFAGFFRARGVAYMHGYEFGAHLLGFFFAVLVLVGKYWRKAVVWEAKDEGHHTLAVQRGLRLGFILFIASEVMFFFAFFWAFFHSALSPTVEIGCIWPPAGIQPFDPWGTPFLNTLLLLLSGLTITVAHHNMLKSSTGCYSEPFQHHIRAYFVYTYFLAFLFTYFQATEYRGRPFSIYDGVYGSTFYMATGFHGLHVTIGRLFLWYCGVRFDSNEFTGKHHVAFEARAWYWHFVDVVWLFLFVTIYWWGNTSLTHAWVESRGIFVLQKRAFFSPNEGGLLHVSN